MLSFVGLGLLLLVGSYAYARIRPADEDPSDLEELTAERPARGR